MKKSLNLMMIVLLVAVLGLMMCVFVVREGSEALVVNLGQIKKEPSGAPLIYGPGIHFKLPYVDTVRQFDIRLQSFDVPSSRVLTEEQKSVDVDYYVQWRVSNISAFFTRTNGNILRAQDLLQRKINDALRASFGDRKLSEVIADDRSSIIQKLTDAASKSAENIGVQVIDVRIKRIDYPKEVTLSVYDRMATQREQVAREYRAEGEMAAEEIRAKADKQAKIIVASAQKAGAELKAQGQKEAALLYNKTYAESDSLFQFWRTLKAYEESFTDNSAFVLDPSESGFLKLLTDEAK